MELIGYDSDYYNQEYGSFMIGNKIKKKNSSKSNKLQRIYTRDKGICQLCMKSCKRIDSTIDHIIPKSHGGSNNLFNLQLSHSWCNGIKGSDKTPHNHDYYLSHTLYGIRSKISNKKYGIVKLKGSKYGIPIEALKD